MIFNFKADLQVAIETNSQKKLLKAGETLVRENSFIQSIPLLVSGLLSVFRTDEDGKEILLYYIRPGESCIMSFLAGLNDDTAKVKALAEEDSELILIPVDRVSQWVKQYPEWTDYIFKLYHHRFEELLGVINSLVFQKMDERLIQHLLRKSELSHQKALNVTHQQLADELGTSREVVSRLLKELEKMGRIQLSRNKILIM